MNLVKFSPLVCQAWAPAAERIIAQWKERGGVLIYRPQGKRALNVLPPCETLLLIEAPFSHREFLRLTKDAKRVIVYRPPTWEFHQEYVDMKHPPVSAVSAVQDGLLSMVGRELDPQKRRILEISGLPTTSAVIDVEEAKALFGMEYRPFRMLLGEWGHDVSRFHVYDLRLRPENPEMAAAFDLMSESPDLTGNGTRALRLNKPVRPMQGFDTLRKLMIREKYIAARPIVFVMNMNRKMNFQRIEDQNLLGHAHWQKMREALDAAPAFSPDGTL